MITEKQKNIIIKCKKKCKELGFEFIEYKKSHIKCKCNKCNEINKPFQRSALMIGNIRCNNCIIIKYKNRCKELGFEYIEKIRKNNQTYIKCKCNKCNEINKPFNIGALKNGNIRCDNCLIIKYKNKCKELDYEFIEYKKKHIKSKCNKCNFVNEPFQSNRLMKGGIRCKNCLKINYERVCKKLGYKYIGHFSKKTTTIIKAKCDECKFINPFQSSALLRNSVKCDCKKPTFVRGFIYRLTIGNYWYIGLTDTTINTRYSCHVSDCLNKRETTKTELKYNSKIYKGIRKELCRITGKTIDKITRKDFRKHVIKKQEMRIDTNKKDLKAAETLLIDKKDKWSLNSIN